VTLAEFCDVTYGMWWDDIHAHALAVVAAGGDLLPSDIRTKFDEWLDSDIEEMAPEQVDQQRLLKVLGLPA
jgi:hypothetical protein